MPLDSVVISLIWISMEASFGTLSGPFIPSQAPSPRACIIFLHGYGGTGHGLEHVAKALGVDHYSFWLPNGHKTCLHYPSGYQWFDLHDVSLTAHDSCPEWLTTRLHRATKTLAHALEDLHKRFANTKLVLSGFSQGASLAYACGLMGYPVEAVLGFSGFYCLDQRPLLTSKLFWAHGQEDHVVNVQWMHQGKANLEAKGLTIESHVFKGVAHTIPKEALDAAKKFLSHHLDRDASSSRK